MSYTDFEDVDHATANLILQLQLDDLQSIREGCKGKGREGDLSDIDLPLEIHNKRLTTFAHGLRDLAVARSIAAAVQSDGQEIYNCTEEETRSYQDRLFACRLGGIEPPSEPVFTLPDIRDLNNEATDSEQESSSSTDYRNERPAEVMKCEICFTEVNNTNSARLPCHHPYCRACLQQLFESSLTDDSLFPPRCCRQHVVVETVETLLTTDLIASFKEKKLEFETKDKTYCSSPSCSKFMRPENIEGECASCPHCNTTTCTVCKSAAHDGEDCPKDTVLAEVLNLATENGWQRCYSCKRVIELDTGCYHMT
ncbi:IBR domain-containing protein [Arthroderma uncinatum]|uniref:IBR domain-containing protein n=1 Tax=Arthroderma uncinatum TaxID=74035 RepID=UPI00144AE557|nr:IBR domain-containing protein [Arthroderma uncinatum]KAF3491330.1 IBR domain-containing protein [Arthroderma uncinatum]